jgi:putative ABC transport system permease protein
MFDLDHLREIWTALAKNRLRTFLTVFGVFGASSARPPPGSGNGLKGMDSGFSGVATNASPGACAPASRSPASCRALDRVHQRRHEKAGRRCRSQSHCPRLQLGGHRGGANATRGIHTGSYSVMGDMPEIQTIQSLIVPRGRFLNHLDVQEKRKVAVIGSRVREVLFEPEEDPLGLGIRINGVEFQVVGVFRSRQSNQRPRRRDDLRAVLDYQQAFNAPTRCTGSRSPPPEQSVRGKTKVLDILRAPQGGARRPAGSVTNLEEEFGKISGLFTGIRILMWIVGLGTLTAGAIGVSNIMLIVVKERTKELGIRRAIGATPWKVQGQIVLESVLLTLGSGLLGLSAGVGLLELVNRLLPPPGASAEPQMFQNPGVTLEAAVLALAVLVASGVLAGLAPARRAVAITPMEALRSEKVGARSGTEDAILSGWRARDEEGPGSSCGVAVRGGGHRDRRIPVEEVADPADRLPDGLAGDHRPGAQDRRHRRRRAAQGGPDQAAHLRHHRRALRRAGADREAGRHGRQGAGDPEHGFALLGRVAAQQGEDRRRRRRARLPAQQEPGRRGHHLGRRLPTLRDRLGAGEGGSQRRPRQPRHREEGDERSHGLGLDDGRPRDDRRHDPRSAARGRQSVSSRTTSTTARRSPRLPTSTI